MCVRLYVCLAETVLALEYCHAQGIIHRDMKVRVCVRMCVCACVYVCLAETVLALEQCHAQGIIHRGMNVRVCAYVCCVCVCVCVFVCVCVWCGSECCAGLRVLPRQGHHSCLYRTPQNSSLAELFQSYSALAELNNRQNPPLLNAAKFLCFAKFDKILRPFFLPC